MPTCTQPSSDARSKMPEGIALPCPWSLKSCTRTGLGEPLGRHSRPPFLRIPDQLLLLGVDRDYRLKSIQRPRGGGVEVLELGVAVGVRGALPYLAVRLQAGAEPPQQPRHSLV